MPARKLALMTETDKTVPEDPHRRLEEKTGRHRINHEAVSCLKTARVANRADARASSERAWRSGRTLDGRPLTPA